MRGDRGTENVVVAQLQTFFHETFNPANTTEHFRYGRSTANQRIENWWCFLRRQCTEFWISFFQMLKRDGLFNGNLLELEIMRFVFMEIIQNDLDEIKMLWNLHPIRRTKNDQLAYGRPVMMFTSPEEYGVYDYIRPVPCHYLQECKEECTFKDNVFCDVDVNEMCILLMQEHGWQKANDAISGRELYERLRRRLQTVV
ncbi:uncharacterized protein LOC128552527 [Mercenaria mercenaria]|uniref:uncharacterized protein LOC128552527 n=1 Tax=Mercenaria mercenaria TaxID=6596 RepID=UPI00234EF347|nr:uncharacterized protein LOC128552527 [Mercenaria mercenaria]